MATDGNTVAALTSGGTVYTWGRSNLGQLGNGTTGGASTVTATPGKVGGLLAGKDIVQIAAGGGCVVALASDGTVYTWGHNGLGTLGDGTTADSSVPVQVTGLLAGVKITQVASSGADVVALAEGGTVYAWGSNINGQLGDGTTTNSSVPVQVSVLPAGVTATQIAAGNYFTVVLGSDGAVYSWGRNTTRQLGNGLKVDSPTPVQPTGLPAGVTVTQIAAGGTNTAVLLSDGSVYIWGGSFVGEGANGTFGALSQAPKLASTLPAGKDIVQVVVGNGTLAALASDGTMYAWGQNHAGQLGDATPTDSAVALQVPLPAGVDVVGAAIGPVAAAVASDGTVYTWGNNTYGQLGQTDALQSVTFGGVAAASESMSAGVITATSPAHAAGTVDVQAVLTQEDRGPALGSAALVPEPVSWAALGTLSAGFVYVGPPVVSGGVASVVAGGVVVFGPATSAGSSIADVAVSSAPGRGTVTVDADGSVTYRAGTATGDETFTVRYTDALGQSSTATYVVSVVAVPDGAASVPQGGGVRFAAVTSFGSLTGAVVGTQPAAGVVHLGTDHSVTYASGSAPVGVYGFTVTYTNSAGQHLTVAYEVTVEAANLSQAAITEEGSISFAPPVGVGGDAQVQIASPPAAGSVSLGADGAATFDPGDAAPGAYMFEVTYTTPAGQQTTVTYTVTVVASAGEQASVPAGGSVTFGAITSLGALSGVQITEQPAAGSVSVNADKSITFHAGDAVPGVYGFQATYTGTGAKLTTVTYAVTVLPTGNKTTGGGTGGSTTGGGSTGGGTSAAVPEEGQVDFPPPAGGGSGSIVSKQPAAGTVVINADGSVSFVPGDAAPGMYSFDVTSTDAQGKTITTTYTVDVLAGPAAPNQTPDDQPATGAGLSGTGITAGITGTGITNAGAGTGTTGAKTAGVTGVSIRTGGLLLTDQVTTLGRWSIPSAALLLAGGLAYLITTRRHHKTS
ncbi:MAG: hypothetical protein FWF28_00085 [Micrococcales bacterium]|nr:hypothetical protein [Micrococcales bacterium]